MNSHSPNLVLLFISKKIKQNKKLAKKGVGIGYGEYVC